MLNRLKEKKYRKNKREDFDKIEKWKTKDNYKRKKTIMKKKSRWVGYESRQK